MRAEIVDFEIPSKSESHVLKVVVELLPWQARQDYYRCYQPHVSGTQTRAAKEERWWWARMSLADTPTAPTPSDITEPLDHLVRAHPLLGRLLDHFGIEAGA